MRTRRRATIEDLRLAIECLPRETKIAMLEGIRANQIIVGDYSDENGICPMLAAHRAGGRPASSRSRRPGTGSHSGMAAARELRKRPGWSWMRVMRRFDENERALAQFEAEQRAHAGAGGELERRG